MNAQNENQSTAATTGSATPAAASSAPATQARKIAVVTGASRGMGRAIAIRLARRGYTVGIHYGSNADAAREALDLVNQAATEAGSGGSGFVFGADLSEQDPGLAFWSAFDTAAAEAGISPLADESTVKIDALVNNAGVFLAGGIAKADTSVLVKNLQVNTIAPYSIVHHGLDRLRDGARIVSTSSGAAKGAAAGSMGYAMSKAAVESFTKSLAAALGERQIRVNAVQPGVTMTDVNKQWFENAPQVKEQMVAHTALGRVGEPDDVAAVVDSLISEDMSWVTGAVIDASGGMGL
nr:SDR family oxidoreductase [Corynebacterium lactis]